jgi:tetratricopeptide (TPR) repeat protein
MRAARSLIVAGLLVGVSPAASFAQAAVDPYFEFLNARHLEGEGDNDGALAALQRAAAAEPKSAEIRAEIASFYLRRNKRVEAEKAARDAVAIDANNVEGNRVLGQLVAANADSATSQPQQAAALRREAITYLERAVAGSSGVVDPNLNYSLGRLYLQAGQADKAQQALARVLSQNPGSVQARITMSQAQAANKDLKGAIATLDEIVDDEPRVAATLAQYQVQAGMLPEAVDNFTRALAVRPMDRQLKAQRIMLLYDMKEFGRAAGFAGDAQKQHPEDVQFPRLQASALFAAGDVPKAIEVLEGTIKQFPKDAASQLSLAEMYGRAKRFGDQERLLRQLIAADPNNDQAMNSLGYMLAINNDRVDEAIRLLQRALQIEPGNPAYLDSLGWAHFRKGNFPEADANLAKAVAQMPTNAEVLEHVGDLRARQGRWQEAIDAWTKALTGEGSGTDKAEIEKKIANAKGKLR